MRPIPVVDLRWLVALFVAPLACADSSDHAAGATVAADAGGEVAPLTASERMDPLRCAGCHPEHYREWSGSMHAYASIDPVFRGLVARGQRETQGALGDRCVRCHAPLALALALTSVGSDMEAVPAFAQGVTCYWCHSIDGIDSDQHPPAVSSSDDGVFRGGIADPLPTPAHGSMYAPTHDRGAMESAALCGSCHDASMREWTESAYARGGAEQRLTCSACHLDGRSGVVAQVTGARMRWRHSHAVAGVDVALTPFPEADAQAAAVRRVVDSSLLAELCVTPGADATDVVVRLDNVTAGHYWPSCSMDRRAWVELEAFDAAGAVIGRWGVVADDEPTEAAIAAGHPVLGIRLVDADGAPALAWAAAGTEIDVLPPIGVHLSEGTTSPGGTHRWTIPGPTPARIAMRVRLRPMARHVLDALVASGDLAPAIRAAAPTYTLAATELEWRPEAGPAAAEPSCRDGASGVWSPPLRPR